jgi:fluoroquinolone transport system permease protein
VTPVRFREYLASKVVSLTVLALTACIIVTLISRGLDFNPLWLVLGVTLTSVVTLLYGFATVMPFSSMSTYTMPANLFIFVLQAALIAHFDWSDFPPLKLLPTYGSLQLVQGGFSSISAPEAVLSLVSSIVWAAIFAVACHRLHRRYVLVHGRD